MIARLDSGEGDRATLNRIEELFTLTKQDMEDAEDLRTFIEETSYNPSSSGAERTEGEAEVALATFDPVLGISDFEELTLGQKRAFLIQKKLSCELMTTYSRTALSKLGSRTNAEPLMETFTEYLAQQSGTGAVMAMPYLKPKILYDYMMPIVAAYPGMIHDNNGQVEQQHPLLQQVPGHENGGLDGNTGGRRNRQQKNKQQRVRSRKTKLAAAAAAAVVAEYVLC